MKVNCEYCGKEKNVETKYYNRTLRKVGALAGVFFCESSCFAKYQNDVKLGKLKQFKVVCYKCNKEFEVEEREKQFPKKEKYFCSRSCARSYSTQYDNQDELKIVNCKKCNKKIEVKKRASNSICNDCKIPIKEKISFKNKILNKINITENDLKELYNIYSSKDELSKYLSISHVTLKKLMNELGYDTDCKHQRKISLNDVIEGNHPQYNTFRLKTRLIEENILEHRCMKCGNIEQLGEKIPLELHHKDGNSLNHLKENLELLCPNCHSFTDNYKGKGKEKIGKKIVSDEELLDMLKSSKNIRQALLKLKLFPAGGNYTRAKKLLEQNK